MDVAQAQQGAHVGLVGLRGERVAKEKHGFDRAGGDQRSDLLVAAEGTGKGFENDLKLGFGFDAPAGGGGGGQGMCAKEVFVAQAKIDELLFFGVVRDQGDG